MPQSVARQRAGTQEIQALAFWKELPVSTRMSIAVFLIPFMVFLGVLGCEFTDWLESSYILTNAIVISPGLPFTWMAISHFQGPYYAPVLWLAYRVGHAIWGLSPAGYHALSLLFHAGCAMLVFKLARQLRLSVKASLFVALLWALHPARVESIAWVMELGRVMGTFFCLLSTLLMFRSIDHPSQPDGQTLLQSLLEPTGERAYTFSLIFLVAGVCSCSALCVWPGLALMIDFVRRSPRGADGLPHLPEGERLVKLEGVSFNDVLPMFLIGAVAGGLAIMAAYKGDWIIVADMGLPIRNILLAGYCLTFHLIKSIVPFGMAPLYPLPEPIAVSNFTYLAGAGVAAVACAAIIWSFKKNIWLCFGLAFLLVALIPYWQIVPVRTAIADRYTYFASIGLFLALGAGIDYFIRRAHLIPDKAEMRDTLKRVDYAGYAAVAVLAALSLGNVSNWEKSENLWRRALDKHPDSLEAGLRLSATLSNDKKYAEAEQIMRLTVEQHPDALAARLNLGRILMEQQKFQEAGARLNEALAMNADDPLVVRLQIEMSLRQGDAAAASAALPKFLETRVPMPVAHFEVGRAFLGAGDFKSASACFRRALTNTPMNPVYLFYSGLAHQGMGELKEAGEQYQIALRMDPNYVPALVGVSDIFVAQNQPEQALAYLRQAAAVNPRDQVVAQRVGEFLAKYPQFRTPPPPEQQ
ncbi:MAG TPA: tetratricopeptide repeat protein [Candidatus Brocadiia bacterium]|nr:tetratricopeptide repeat protein [Candidatus Brocadiia bacterium]